jgi:hypothetical protein
MSIDQSDLEAIFEEIMDFEVTPDEEDYINSLLDLIDEGKTLTYAQINALEEIYEAVQERE